jgi:colanic acid biosynthesis glycosyl transferase WcaI
LLFRITDGVARMIYRRADHVVALGPAMANALRARGVSPDRLTVIHNWSDASAIHPVPPESNPFLEEHGLNGRHVILYSGNAGRAHTFKTLIDSMCALRGRDDIAFVFVGGGPRTLEIKNAVSRHELRNVTFLPYVPRERLHDSLSAATISIVTENPELVGLLVPSKAYGILASGRPILYVGSSDSDIALLIRELECGEVVGADDPDGLAAAIERLCGDALAREAMGRRARQAAIERFDRRHGVRQWHGLLSSVGAS